MQKSDEARFFGKNPISPFLGKKGSKWPKNRVFANLTKIQSINVHFFLLKMKEHNVSEFSAKTACPGKIWFSSYRT